MRDLGKLIVAKGFQSGPKSTKSPNLVTLSVAEGWADPQSAEQTWVVFNEKTLELLEKFFFFLDFKFDYLVLSLSPTHSPSLYFFLFVYYI